MKICNTFPQMERRRYCSSQVAITEVLVVAGWYECVCLFQKLELDRFMLYAHGPDLCRESDLRHAMANCFEALIGKVPSRSTQRRRWCRTKKNGNSFCILLSFFPFRSRFTYTRSKHYLSLLWSQHRNMCGFNLLVLLEHGTGIFIKNAIIYKCLNRLLHML